MSDRRPTPAPAPTPLPSLAEQQQQRGAEPPAAPPLVAPPPSVMISGAAPPVRVMPPPGAAPMVRPGELFGYGDKAQQRGGAHYRDGAVPEPVAPRGLVRAWLARSSFWQRATLAIVLASVAGLVAILVWAVLVRPR